MATSQANYVCDNSTLANFKSWAQAISNAFSAAGFVQSSDSGQVNWSSIASVPGSGAFVYEIWKSNDGLTQYYVKIEYGNWTNSGPSGAGSSSNCPTIRISVGSGSNGSGTLTSSTGSILGPVYCNQTSYTPPSTTSTYECSFTYSGSGNRFGAMMWRNGSNGCQQVFTIERSRDNSGAYTSTHVTVIVAGAIASAVDVPRAQQASYVFGVGATTGVQRNASTDGGFPALCCRTTISNPYNGTSAFNSNVPFDTVSPSLGYYDVVCTMMGFAHPADITEGIAFSIVDTPSGATITYLPTKTIQGIFGFISGNVQHPALCMRFD